MTERGEVAKHHPDDISIALSAPDLNPEQSGGITFGKVVSVVCPFYGVAIEGVLENKTSDQFVRPRAVIAHLLRKKLDLHDGAIGHHLQREERSVSRMRSKIENEISEKPWLAAQVGYIEHTIEQGEQITVSLSERIVMRAEEAVKEGDETMPINIITGQDDQSILARQLAVTVMANIGNLSDLEIAKFFGLSPKKTTSVVYRAKEVVYHAYAQPENEKLRQQLSYILGGIFSEKVLSFTFSSVTTHGHLDHQFMPPSAHNLWQEDSKDLVNEKIRDKVYLTAQEAAAFYGHGVNDKDVLGRTNNFYANRARRATMLMCIDEVPIKELAVCLDAREITKLYPALARARKYAQEYPIFAEELVDLANGEKRRDLLDETRWNVMRYFNMQSNAQRSELRAGEGYWPDRARSTFLAIMSQYDWTTAEELGSAIGRSEVTTQQAIRSAKKRLKEDARFRDDVEYLMNPAEVERPPRTEDVAKNISERRGIPLESILGPKTPKEQAAKGFAAYVLAVEFGLPHDEIAKTLQEEKSRAIEYYLTQARKEITTGQVVSYALKHHGVTLDDVATKNETYVQKFDKVRDLTLRLLQKKDPPSAKEISSLARIFAMTEAEIRDRFQL